MKIRLLMICLCILRIIPERLAAQPDEFYFYPPVYYKETPFGYEIIEGIPRDTVYIRDTVYVSDIDEFLRSYTDVETGLGGIVSDIGQMQALLGSLDGMTSEKLFYNFFLRTDTLDRVSGSFIVREFALGEDLAPETVSSHEPGNAEVRRGILFRIDGNDRTLRFLRHPEVMCRTISYLFTRMQEDPDGIRCINLYFPDYNFRQKRAMIQFVKSVRVIMDASRDFKFGETTLNVILHSRKGYGDGVDRDFQYSLEQEATSVIFIDGMDVLNHFYVKGRRADAAELDKVGLFHKIRSHFYIARYYTGDTDILQLRITDFSPENIRDIAFVLDYKENNWEVFFFIALAILVLLMACAGVYLRWAAFYSFVNRQTESVLLTLVVVVVEMGVLILTIFQNMCKEDNFTIIERHPVLIFLLPLLIVLVAPVLHRIIRNRRMP